MAFVPCGCEDVLIQVDPCHFDSVALQAGDQDTPLRIRVADDKSAALGGRNIVDVGQQCGIYVPENNQTLNGGNGVTVTGTGGSTPWTASVDLSNAPGQIATFVGGELYVPESAAAGVSSQSCDEAMSQESDGFSAGAKHYSVNEVAFVNLTNTNGAGGFNNVTSPHTGPTASLSIANPSCARSMSVKWTITAELPATLCQPSTVISYNLYEAPYLLSGAAASPTVVGQAMYRNDFGEPLTGIKYPTLTYTASGIIPPNDTLRVDARLDVVWNQGTGSLSFDYNSAFGALLPANPTSDVLLRIDAIGSTT